MKVIRWFLPLVLAAGLTTPLPASRAADLSGADPAAAPPGSLAAAILNSTLALTNGLTPPPKQGEAYAAFTSPMQYAFGAPPPDPKWTNWVYTRNPAFWLNGLKGLDALNVFPYQMQLTLVTPRHCLTVEHMRGCGSNVMVCFVGTNNTVYWRRSLGTIAIGKELRACILDAPVPITPMPVIALADLTNKISLFDRPSSLPLPAKGLPMIMFNQFWRGWAGEMDAVAGHLIHHQDRSTSLNGWSWAVTNSPVVGSGDSGSARCLVIEHQLYLTGVGAYLPAEFGIYDIEAINAALDELSKETRQPKNHVTRLNADKYSRF